MQPKLLIATTVSSTLTAFLLPFARHFRARGWRVDAIANGVSGCCQCRKEFDNVCEVNWSRDSLSLRNPLAVRELQTLIRRNDYDLIHAHTPVAGFLTRIAAKGHRKRTRIIYTAHGFHFHAGGEFLRNSVYRTLERIAGRWTDRLVVINREDEKAALENRIVDRARLRYMPGIGVDLAQCRASDLAAVQVRRDLQIPDVPLFLTAAEFIRRKRHADLLHAFASMRNRKSHLALCGEGPLLESIRQLAFELKIDERIHFLGFRHDMPSLLALASAAVLVSDQEGLPRSVMEAMAMSRPVIGSNIRGTRDLLENHIGILVPLGDTGKIASALDWVVEHPKEAKSMGTRASEAVKQYDINRILSMHDTMYGELLGQAGDITKGVL
jgi:glycosyltransferase involved in cell wall biosynthesis